MRALDYLNSRNLNYRVEYKWAFPKEVPAMKEAGWFELRRRRAVMEPFKVPPPDDITDAPPQDFEFIYQIKMCRETFYARGARA